MACASLTLTPSTYLLVFLHKQTLAIEQILLSNSVCFFILFFCSLQFCGHSLVLYSEDIWSKYEVWECTGF